MVEEVPAYGSVAAFYNITVVSIASGFPALGRQVTCAFVSRSVVVTSTEDRIARIAAAFAEIPIEPVPTVVG